ncbi:hypothetical protein DFJ77DRAFT_435142, partial [Powellomyces hirtus]
MSFEIAPSVDGVTIKVEYDLASVSALFVDRLLRGYKVLIEQISVDPLSIIENLSIVDLEDEELMAAWNGFSPPMIPKEHCVHNMIEERVQAQPNHPAAVFEDGQSLTYGELNARANRLARYLRKQQIGPDSLIALCMARSLQMIVAMLAIIKSGGAYVPLDAQIPLCRNLLILKNTKANIVITEGKYAHFFAEADVLTITMDTHDDCELPWAKECEENLIVAGLNVDHLLFCLHTSGSTGVPKGVMVTHGAIIYSIREHAIQYRISKETRWLQFAAYTFDVSVMDIFCSLTQGATLCLAHKESLLADMGAVGRKMQATFATLTPTVLSALLQPGDIPTLTGLGISGEAMTQPIIDSWSDNVMLQNAFGPTECAVNVTMKHMLPGDRAGSIGKPLHGTFAYIVDAKLRRVPVGIVGELLIGGPQLARGYLARPDLTAERFIDNPCAIGTRAYRTGDLARFDESGEIFFLGRCDSQVKLRGLRIELMEVEVTLLRASSLLRACCCLIINHQGQDHMIAYLSTKTADVGFKPLMLDPSEEGVLDLIARCKDFAEQTLPSYMVPSFFAVIDRMPLTSAGKADRKSMPRFETRALHGTSTPSEGEPTPPGEFEMSVLSIAREVLRNNNLDFDDNLFTAGMNSLTTIRFIARLQEATALEMKISDVF